MSGYVAKRTVQVGQRVAPGAPLMSIVPLDQVWVDANFKEVQLRNMRIGQPVTLTADAYGKAVEYHGTVAGLGVGTGSAFALLPAQNATGNWIKVVQRVPVRIALDPKELAAHPLRVGLSMEVDGRRRGHERARRSPSAPRGDTAYATDAFDARRRGSRRAGARDHRRQPRPGDAGRCTATCRLAEGRRRRRRARAAAAPRASAAPL